MCEELSYQIINTSAVNQCLLLLLEVFKNHYKKENISVSVILYKKLQKEALCDIQLSSLTFLGILNILLETSPIKQTQILKSGLFYS